MTLETLILAFIAGYFVWRLYGAINEKKPLSADKIRLVSPQTGEVMEMQIVKAPLDKAAASWDEAGFLTGAKWAFQKTLSAFAACDLKTLKNTLDSDVYSVFEQDILARTEKKQKMDFSLICFDSAEILSKTPDNSEVTVRFKTEQINLLKDADGNVIEGDKMNIATMTDIWVFRKIGKEEWIIAATKSRMAHA